MHLWFNQEIKLYFTTSEQGFASPLFSVISLKSIRASFLASKAGFAIEGHGFTVLHITL